MGLKRSVIAVAILIPAAAWGQEELAPMALNSFSAPPSRIVTAEVETPKGQVVGHVERVITDAQGKPSALAVRSAEGTVTVPAASASYDPSHNLVVADIPSRQVANSGH